MRQAQLNSRLSMGSKGSPNQKSSPKSKDREFVQIIDTESLELFVNDGIKKKAHPLGHLISSDRRGRASILTSQMSQSTTQVICDVQSIQNMNSARQ